MIVIIIERKVILSFFINNNWIDLLYFIIFIILFLNALFPAAI